MRTSAIRAPLPATGGGESLEQRRAGRRGAPIERDEIGAERARQPEIAGVVDAEPRGVREDDDIYRSSLSLRMISTESLGVAPEWI
jgi:hypothetical protein